MSLVVSRSDGKRHRGVLFRGASGKEPGVGQGKRFIAELGRLFGVGTRQSRFGDLRPEFGEDGGSCLLLGGGQGGSIL